MILLSKADKLVREFIPVIFDSTNNVEVAQQFRDLKCIDKKAINLFEKTKLKTFDTRFQHILFSVCFWGQAALLAAYENDTKSFITHLSNTQRILEKGLNNHFRN